MVPITGSTFAGTLQVIRTSVCRDIVPSGRWDKHVVVYGGSDLTKAHPVVSFLAKEKRARSLAIFKPGCEPLQLTPSMSPRCSAHPLPGAVNSSLVWCAGLMPWTQHSLSSAAPLPRQTPARGGC